MEDGGNMFEKQVIDMSCKTKVQKPPTRLQMYAPASLQLDQMKADAAITSPFGPFDGTSETATPIPLLTPLALSPNQFPDTEDYMFLTDDKKAATPAPAPAATAIGWQNLAGAGYVEPSTLFTLFQNKCVLVNDAQ